MKAKREVKVLEREPDTVAACASRYLSEVVGEGTSYVDNTRRVLNKDILPGASPSWGRAPYLGRSYRIVG
jgi:hypothetical protein